MLFPLWLQSELRGDGLVWGLLVLPDVLVGDGEGLAERLRRVEPDCRILLSRYRRLSRNRSRAHVQSAGDGRQQGVITSVWTDTCPMRERDQEMGQRSRQAEGLDSAQAVVGDLLCNPLGRSMVRRTCSVTSDDRRPFNLFSQNSCRQTDRQLFIWSSHWFLISFSCSFWRQFQI